MKLSKKLNMVQVSTAELLTGSHSVFQLIASWKR